MAKPSFTGDFKNQEQKDQFLAIRKEMGFENWQDMFLHLYDMYQNEDTPDPQVQAQLQALQAENTKLKQANQQLAKEVESKGRPKSSDSLFIASLSNETYKKLIQEMREFLDEKYNYISDLQIIIYLSRLNRDIKNKSVHIIRPAKRLNANILEEGEKLVDEGTYQNMNHFLSKMIEKGMQSLKKSSWL